MKRSVLIIFMTHEEPVTGIAVASLLPQLTQDDRLLLLHNGAGDQRFGEKYGALKGVEYYEADDNLGVAGGRNLLFNKPSCRNADLVFLVDSDAFVPSDYLDRMTAFMGEHDDIGIAGPVVLDFKTVKDRIEPHAEHQPSALCGRYLSLDTPAIERSLNGELPLELIDHIGTNAAWADAYINWRDMVDSVLGHAGLTARTKFHVGQKFDLQQRRALTKRVGGPAAQIDVTNIAGCCQVFRRSLLDDVGDLFDLYSPYGLEDVDFAVRALQRGLRNVTTNATYMLHKTDQRHDTRTTSDGHFQKRRNDSRTRTLFEYRWDRESFPRNSLRRVLVRSFRQSLDANGDFDRVKEGLVAEVLGIRAALRQLALSEGEALGALLSARAAEDPPVRAIYQLLDEDGAEACGLASDAAYQAEQAKVSAAMRPVPTGPKWPRFDTGLMADLRADVRGRERFGNAYKATKQGVIRPEEREVLAAFKDRHKGERCFIVGNGPSLNKTDFNLLRNEVTFAVNGIFYLFDQIGYTPTYYVVEDNHVVDDNLERIIHYPVTHKFFPEKYRPAIGGLPGVNLLPANWEFYYKSSKWYETPRFSRDVAKTIYVGQTVTYMNMQLAHYMGFEQVILIGVDFSYSVPETSTIEGLTIVSNEDDPNHFHPAYFGKGKKWHFPKLHNCEKVYRHAREVFEEDGREILDATIGGKLDVYKKPDFYTLFDDDLKLDQPNDPLIFFVRRILLEQLGRGGDDCVLSLDGMAEGQGSASADLKRLADWYRERLGQASAVRSGDETEAATNGVYRDVHVTDQAPGDGPLGDDALLVVVDGSLVTDAGAGWAGASPALTMLMEHYRHVVLHGNFALATNGTLPDFLRTDFGVETDMARTRRMNVSASLEAASQSNTRSVMVSCDIPRVGENVFGLPESSLGDDAIDLSLAAALLESSTPVYIRKGRRLLFPR